MHSPRYLLVTAAMAIVALVGFALPFYFLLGVLKWKWQYAPAVCGVIGTIPVLAAVWVASRFAPRQPAGPRLITGREAAEHARRAAEFQANIDKLAADPRWARWSDLVRQRRLVSEEILEKFEKRYQELAADPKRRQYVATLLKGTYLTNRQIDYQEDKTLLVTCAHLQPVERAIRAAAIPCWALEEGAYVRAQVAFDGNKLRAKFALADCVKHEFDPGHGHQGPEEYLTCTQCRSSIDASSGGTSFPP